MKKTLKVTSTIITVLIFVLAIYIMVFGAIARKNNKLLNFFGYSYSYVPTDSMVGDNDDSFDAGSIVISKKVKFESLKVGDIIIYQNTTSNNVDILVVHRIVEVLEDNSYITKGDNNSVNDTVSVTNDNYQAKVINSFKVLNIGSSLGTYQLQLLFMLIILLSGFTVFQIFNIVKAIRNEKLEEIEKQEELNKELLREEILKEIKKEKEE